MPTLPGCPSDFSVKAGQGRQLQCAHESLRIVSRPLLAGWIDGRLWHHRWTHGQHLLKAFLSALYAVEKHVELPLWPCWHKCIHNIAGCANAPAGSKKRVIVQLIMTWATSRVLEIIWLSKYSTFLYYMTCSA